MTDATFEDGREAPLNLGAEDGEDLKIIASLLQDAVFPRTEMKWDRSNRRFGILLNRFRWEDRDAADKRNRAYERVQSLLVVENVIAVASQGLDLADKDTILSLLTLDFTETDAPDGELLLTLAGDGAIRLKVEALEIRLKDVTRPYLAPSRHAPDHPA